MTLNEVKPVLSSVPAGPQRALLAITLLRQRHVTVARRAGISPSYLSLILNGHRDSDRSTQRAISKAIGLPVSDLFGEAA